MIHYKINTSTDRKVDHDRFLVYLKFYLINRLPLKWYFKLDLVIMVPDGISYWIVKKILFKFTKF